MDHTFTFFVLGVAILGFFIDEFASIAKQYWKNNFLRHGGLMMFIGIMGFAYQPSIKQLLTLLLKFTSAFSLAISSVMPLFRYKVLIALGLIQITYVSCFVGMFLLCFYIAKRDLYPFWQIVLWATWLTIGTIFISVIHIPTLFHI